MTTSVKASVDVGVPVRTAYDQWTQFEDFPRFMHHVERVHQVDDRHLHWVARLGGQRVEWDAEISEQIPDKRIAWHSVGGARHAGVVTFHRLSDDRCRVMLQLEFEPEGVIEKAGTALGLSQKEIEMDLRRFAEFVEKRGRATGAWRGEIASPDDAQG